MGLSYGVENKCLTAKNRSAPTTSPEATRGDASAESRLAARTDGSPGPGLLPRFRVTGTGGARVQAAHIPREAGTHLPPLEGVLDSVSTF